MEFNSIYVSGIPDFHYNSKTCPDREKRMPYSDSAHQIHPKNSFKPLAVWKKFFFVDQCYCRKLSFEIM